MDKRHLTKCVVGLACTAILATASLQVVGGLPIPGLEPSVIYAQDQDSRAARIVSEIRAGARGPIYGGYFRTWHDKAATDKEKNESFNRPNSIEEVPAGVDVLFIFEDWTHPQSPFWNTLKTQYIPKMHAQGTAVVQTIGVKELIGKSDFAKSFANDEEGNKALAKALVQKYVYDRGVDGLDIDVEREDYDITHNLTTEEELARATAVFQEITKLIGKSGEDTSKLLIMDTTLSVEKNPLFVTVAGSLDLVLRQYYGSQKSNGDDFGNLNKDWEGYRKYIEPRQFLIGFSFYEENDRSNRWGDINNYDPSHPESAQSIEGTRAQKYATWQPKTGGLKGGIFSYALDRDGVGHPRGGKKGAADPETDKIVHTDYPISRALKALMMKDDRYDEIDASDFRDPVLLEAVKSQVGLYRGDLALFDKTLKLENLAIKDLAGLEKLSHAASIELSGLNELKSLRSQDLPGSVRKNGQIKLSHMTGLEVLELPSCHLEDLSELGVQDLVSLKKFDLSKNQFDFAGDKEGLETLIFTVTKNNPGDVASSTLFEQQQPKGYLPRTYAQTEVQVPISDAGYNIQEESVFGSVTKVGYPIGKASDFANYKELTVAGKPFVDPSWAYEQFAASYKDHSLVTYTSNLEEGTSWTIPTDKNETYTVHVFHEGQEVHRMTVQVGSGQKVMTNLSLEAKPVNAGYDMDGVIKKALDNDKSTEYTSYQETSDFTLDLGGLSDIRYIRLINEQEIGGLDRSENIVKEAIFLVPKDASVTEISNLKEEDWVQVAEVKDGKVIEGQAVNTVARFCKFLIKETQGHGVPYLSEFQVLGWKVDDVKYTEATKMVATARSEAEKAGFTVAVATFDQAVTEAMNTLAANGQGQAGLNAVADKLVTLATDLKTAAEAKSAGYSIQEQYRALKNSLVQREYSENWEQIQRLLAEAAILDSRIDAKLGEPAYAQALKDLVEEMKLKMKELADIAAKH